MSEMIELAKIAALTALAEHACTTDIQEVLVRGSPRGSIPPGALDKMVRATIEAMRHPTEAMLEAASIEAQKPSGWHMVYRNILRAMIDAALKA